MNKALNLLSHLVLLLLGVLSIGALMVETFSVSVPRETWLWIVLLCTLLWLASVFRRGILVGMPLSALVLWYLYKADEEDLLLELNDLLEHVNASYFGHFSSSGSVYLYTDQAQAHMTAVILVLFLIAAFFTVALASGSFRVSLVHLVVIPLFALCLVVNGKPPVLPVLGIILFCCGVYLTGDVFRTTDGAGKAMLFGLIPCMLVLAGTLLLYNPDNYRYNEEDIDLSLRFDSIGNALSKWMNREGIQQESVPGIGETGIRNYEPPSGWRSGTDELVLTRSFDYSALSKEAFRVTADLSGTLYFRGKSFGDYLGNAWGAAVENTHAHALSYTAMSISGSELQELRSFQLQSQYAYDLLYLPYFSISDTENDVGVPSGSLNSYGGDFYLSTADFDTLRAVKLPGALSKEEKQYEEYAHTYYTRLPESTASAMQEFCRSAGLTSDRSDLITAVAGYVRSHGIYDINAEPYAGDDYAVYFLSGLRSGYCIHFATAATVLYRSLGVPARICEGYMVNFTPGESVIVTGQDAHAWVEVYLDGIGWFPVEVTASQAENPDAQVLGTTENPPDGPEDETTQPDQEADSETPPVPTGPGAETEDGLDASDNSEESGSGEGHTPPEDSGGTASSDGLLSRILRILMIPAGLLLLASAFYGRYVLLRSRMEKRLSEPDGRIRVIHIYRQAERLGRYGAEMPPVIRAAAEKAAFSQHEISAEEQDACLSALSKLTDETWKSLSGKKRFFFRFLSGNI